MKQIRQIITTKRRQTSHIYHIIQVSEIIYNGLQCQTLAIVHCKVIFAQTRCYEVVHSCHKNDHLT